MELCSGGSLFTMLENPTNAYGFQEEEFKQVVKDVGQYTVMKPHEDLLNTVNSNDDKLLLLLLLLLHDYHMTNNYYYYMIIT